MDDLEQRLRDLSAKATGGVWITRGDGGIDLEDDSATWTGGAVNDTALMVALVNAYRAGELVPATTLAAKDAEIARLREALDHAPLPGRGEEMMAFRDRTDVWVRDFLIPTRATGGDRD